MAYVKRIIIENHAIHTKTKTKIRRQSKNAKRKFSGTWKKMAIHFEQREWCASATESSAVAGPAILLLPNRARGARYTALPGMHQIIYCDEAQLSENIAWIRNNTSGVSQSLGQVNFVLQERRNPHPGALGGGGSGCETGDERQEGFDIESVDGGNVNDEGDSVTESWPDSVTWDWIHETADIQRTANIQAIESLLTAGDDWTGEIAEHSKDISECIRPC